MYQGGNQKYASPEEVLDYILEHHGVKGMRWGIRNEDKPVGRSTSGIPPRSASGKLMAKESPKATEYDRLAQAIAKRAGVDPNLAAAKYGPPQLQSQAERERAADREKLKKVAIGVGVGVGVAGLGIAAYKLNKSGLDINQVLSDKKKLAALFNTSSKAYGSQVDGLNLNWDKGVDLPKGFILRRLSSVAETAPRPNGFFAAHLDSDVESYKAILPTFWKRWGVGSAEAGGFINHYRAKEAIRAPSGKESFELFKHLVDTDDDFNIHFKNLWNPNGIRGLSDSQLKKVFVDSSMNWADDSSFTDHWFKAVRERGYNALIDFNDAGRLGKTPLRLIDGNMFDIVKNEPQSLNHFYTAAKAWTPELVHLLIRANGEHVLIHIDDFLRAVKLGCMAIEGGQERR